MVVVKTLGSYRGNRHLEHLDIWSELQNCAVSESLPVWESDAQFTPLQLCRFIHHISKVDGLTDWQTQNVFALQIICKPTALKTCK